MESVERKMDQIGRVVIPRHMRTAYGIDGEGTDVELIPMKDGILIRQLKPSCIVCKSEDKLVNYRDRFICEECLKGFNEQNK